MHNPELDTMPRPAVGQAGRLSPIATLPRWTRMTGGANSIHRLEAAIRRVAEFECTTLITGETGCGKEEVARAIHAAGPRRDKPFISVNCAGIPAAIAESQLFGHEKGSFTGASGPARGAIRSADGGVVFLDEIGDMPPDLQPKLLGFLERREVTPVGSSQSEPVDVMVIAATNRHLESAVAEGAFREDLLYRLNTVHLVVPPLRDRSDDIPRFVAHFSAHYAARYGQPPWVPGPATLARFVEHDWPGNVRQLAQTIQKLYVFADTREAVLDEVLGKPAARERPPGGTADRGGMPAGPEAAVKTFNLRELRRRTVREALEATEGHFAKAARLLGVCPNTMTKLVAEACPERVAGRTARSPRPR
ncbi:MAG: sigma-54 dependent transcriptional regulator [Planctomycetia bacterium]|nr:sigma-54 dependent transcriptional regulator [Planctomycetia bacterium]